MPTNAPHAPSAAAVKIAYVQALTDAYKPMDDAESSEMRREFAAEFDRFLAAHDAQVARNAAREALDGLVETLAVDIEFLAFGAGDEFNLAIELAESFRDDEYPEEPTDA